MKFHASGLWRKALPLLVICDVALARRLAYCCRQIDEDTQRDIACDRHRKRGEGHTKKVSTFNLFINFGEVIGGFDMRPFSP